MSKSQQILLEDIESHLRRSGMHATGFGKVVMNDPNFVHELRAGRLVQLPTRDKIYEWLDEQRTA